MSSAAAQTGHPVADEAPDVPAEIVPTEIVPTEIGAVPTDTPAAPVKKRLEVLDGVRLFAAMLVVVFHFAGGDRGVWQTPTAHLFHGPLFSVASYGWLGVELFFMISGFVICMSSWGKTVGQFAITRIVRLYPAYWFCILLTTIVLALDPSFFPALGWRQILANLPMTEGYAHTPHYVDPSYWTLAIELCFYVTFSFMLLRGGLNYRRVVWFCVTWLSASMLTIWVRWWLADLVLQPNYTPFFVSGLLCYLIYRFGPSRLLWALLTADWLCAMYRMVSRTSAQEHRAFWHLHYWIAALIVTGFFVLLVLVALGKLTAIRGRWLVTAGALTYPLYLLHQQIGETAIRSLHPYVPAQVLVVLVFVGLLGLSWLVHRYVERPVANRMKTALTAGRTAVLAKIQTRREPAHDASSIG